jgi:hypothetical protein
MNILRTQGNHPTYNNYKENKIPRCKFNEGTKDHFSESYKPLKKEIEEDIRRWKALPCSQTGRINILKMAILPKAIYMVNTILIKIPLTFFIEIEKSILNFIWNQKRSQIQAILSKKYNFGSITIPNFNRYYRVIQVKTAWYWHKNRHDNKWIRIEDPNINSHSYSQPFLTKEHRAHDGEKTASSTNVAGKTGYPHVED